MSAQPGDRIQKFQNALTHVILTGINQPHNFDLHDIPPPFFKSISESLIPLINWRLDAVSSPKKEGYRRILKWIQKRIQNVLEQGDGGEKCEFEESEVRTEIEKLLEFPGRMAFSRIFSDHQEYDDAFKTIDLGNISGDSSSYVILGDTSAVQDEESSFMVFPVLEKSRNNLIS